MTTILAVDRQQDDLELLTQILDDDYEVLTSLSGEECLQQARAFQPELILLDVQVPEMDGSEVLEKLQKDPHTRDIPVILIATREGDSDRVVKGLEAGAFDYVSKPVDDEVLLARIRVTLRVRQRTAELAAANAQLRSLASNLVNAEGRLRRHIATYLHDDLGQILSTCKIKLQALKELLGDAGPPKLLDGALRMQDEMINKLRSITAELSLPAHDEIGFRPAMELLVKHMLEQHGLTCTYEDDGECEDMPEETEALCFRAARELLFNVVKHARAGRATIRCSREDGGYCLRVQDDGCGFDPEKVGTPAQTGSFGLFSLRELLEQLGESLVIDSALDRGTTVTLRFPAAGPAQSNSLPPRPR